MKVLKPGNTLGILGGGQLGRMMAVAASHYGLRIHIFDPDPQAPAAEVAGTHTSRPYSDKDALTAFADACDVVTFEFENIPHDSLEAIADAVPLRPGPKSLYVSQDRLTEKQFLTDNGLTLAPYQAINSTAEIADAHTTLGEDTILKARRLGYDGKGQSRLSGRSIDGSAVWQAIGAVPAVLEKRIPFVAEVSAVIARAADGATVAYDVPINVHRDGILHTSSVGAFAPMTIPDAIRDQAQSGAMAVATALEHVGILTVEYFLTQDDQLLVNEIAPRVHNSGHWTMDACWSDQFDNHIRAVAGWSLAPADRYADARMTNLLGEDVHDEALLAGDGARRVHIYGKREARPGRKMGHVTEVSPRSTNSAR